MPICVISTTGTSVFLNANASIQEEWKQFRTANRHVDLNAICRRTTFDGLSLYHRVLEHLRAETKATDVTEVIRKASAELNSLSRILVDPPTRSDQLYFLASATPDGALAARIISDFSREFFKVEHCEVKLIDGLQVSDGGVFQKDGVRNLIAAIYDALHNAPESTYTRVINPTGGFKGVVPYLTLIGMIEPGIRLSYIYEQSKNLISLGRVPLQFDFGLLEGAQKAIEAAREDFVTEVDLKALLNLKPDQSLSDHPAWALFDQTTQGQDVYFSLNGLGRIVLEHISSRSKVQIYLSKQAKAKFDSLDANLRTQLGRIFEQMRSSEWVKINLHATGSDRLKVLKSSGAERPLFYWDDDGSVVIADIGLKNDGSYDRITDQLSTFRRADFPPFALWERKSS